MKTDIIGALIYLCKNHATDACKLNLEISDIPKILGKAGFNEDSIKQTHTWWVFLKAEKGGLYAHPGRNTIRIFSKREQFLLASESWEFLLKLEKQGIVDPVSRELVLSQLSLLPLELITLGLFKWIILIVLSNQVSEDKGFRYLDFITIEKEILREVYK